MKKNVTVRMICLVVAAVVLSGSVAFAAVIGSPYETLKRAALGAATYSNVTMQGLMTVSYNGVVQNTDKSYSVIGDEGTLRHHFDREGNQAGWYFSSDGLSISSNAFTGADGNEWYSASVFPSTSGNSRTNYAMMSPEELTSARVRFMELLVDLVVGDLKNNLTMSSSGGTRTIRGTLTESQIPELAKAGIDLAIEQSGSYMFHSRTDISFDGGKYVWEDVRFHRGDKTVATYSQPCREMSPEEQSAWDDGTFWDEFGHVDNWGFHHTYDDLGMAENIYILTGPQETISEITTPATRDDYSDSDELDIPMKSLKINYVRGEAVIDPAGNLLSINISGAATITNIFNETGLVELEADFRFSDIGTSVPTSPIPGANHILTTENMKDRFGSERSHVFFTLKPDGSIDADSITTTYPGELEISAEKVYWLEQSGSSTMPVPVPMPYVTATNAPEPVPMPSATVATDTITDENAVNITDQDPDIIDAKKQEENSIGE